MTLLYNIQKLRNIRRILRKQEVSAERLLWSKIRNRQLGVKFKRQYSVGNYVIDFYCPEIRLGIEIDGSTHSTSIEIARDLKRENYLRKTGIKIKRFTNVDVFENLDGVITSVLEVIKTSPAPLLIKERG